jgi:alcohol dehydrogenase class IV
MVSARSPAASTQRTLPSPGSRAERPYAAPPTTASSGSEMRPTSTTRNANEKITLAKLSIRAITRGSGGIISR